MEISIMWRQDYEELPCAEGQEQTKLDKPIWKGFDMDYLQFHSRTYFKNMFNHHKTPVIIKELSDKTRYITNSAEVLKQYKDSGKSVCLLSDCADSLQAIIDVGFTK